MTQEGEPNIDEDEELVVERVDVKPIDPKDLVFKVFLVVKGSKGTDNLGENIEKLRRYTMAYGDKYLKVLVQEGGFFVGVLPEGDTIYGDRQAELLLEEIEANSASYPPN